MKRILFLLFFGLVIFFPTYAASPVKAAVLATCAAIKGDAIKLKDLVAVCVSSSYEDCVYKEIDTDTLDKLLKQKEDYYKEVEQKGGLKEIVAVKNDSGKSFSYENKEKTEARVSLKVVCKNGEELDTGKIYMVKHKKKWKILLR